MNSITNSTKTDFRMVFWNRLMDNETLKGPQGKAPLDPMTQLVLLHLIHVYKNKQCLVSLSILAARIGTCDKTIARAIDRLIKAGLIKDKKRSGQKNSNIYRINFAADLPVPERKKNDETDDDTYVISADGRVLNANDNEAANVRTVMTHVPHTPTPVSENLDAHVPAVGNPVSALSKTKNTNSSNSTKLENKDIAELDADEIAYQRQLLTNAYRAFKLELGRDALLDPPEFQEAMIKCGSPIQSAKDLVAEGLIPTPVRDANDLKQVELLIS